MKEKSLTISEKIERLTQYCQERAGCDSCILTSYCDNGDFETDDDSGINKAYEMVFESSVKNDVVNHPSHYTTGKIECIDFITDKELDFCLGNVVKYVVRAGKKDESKEIEDLKKAAFYLDYYIKMLEKSKEV